ncbi:hypothetical protein BT93_B0417 [Corymbia citriodora subsp. variegata]|nr:hypothetical protein BT93_B0417 [Corymbia citriodora subsp. variegata]
MKMSVGPPLCFLIMLLLLSLSLFSVSCRGQEQENGSSGAPMERGEQEALYSAIQGFVGKWWNGSDLYPDPCGWTPIQGVECDLYNGSWYVSALNIGPVYENSLRCAPDAELTHHLFELKHLTSLSVYSCFSSTRRNTVRVSISSWGRLSNTLESLEFRSNPGLVGTIPTSIGSLKQLQSLVILENGLTGPLPMELANLISLKRLVLSSNGFVGQIPPAFGGLNSLLILDCSRNNLSGPLPLTFGGLTSLLKLDLSSNGNLDGFLPRELGNLRNLTLLDIGGNKFSGGLIRDIQGMISLKEMVMSNNPTLRGDLTSIEWANLQDLEALELSYTGLTGRIPESMTQLKRLRFLGLSDNSLLGTPPPELASLPYISSLYLNGNNLTGQLDFPGTFYGKMGRRFSAWNNPNLCWRPPLTPWSAVNVPVGVRPCSEGGNASSSRSGSSLLVTEMSEGLDVLHQDSQIEVSLGCRSRGVDGSGWGSRSKEMMALSAWVLLLVVFV